MTATIGIAEGEYRRILRLINGETHFQVVQTALRDYTEDEVYQWLSELERRGLLASTDATTTHDLDFTGSFNISELVAARRNQTK